MISTDHGKNQSPENQQPEKRKQIPLFIEKEDGPEKIEDKLQRIEKQCLADILPFHALAVYDVGGNSHQDIQDRPDYRKQPRGRRQRRFCHGIKHAHGIAGQQAGYGPHCYRDQNTDHQFFFFDIHLRLRFKADAAQPVISQHCYLVYDHTVHDLSPAHKTAA